MKLILIAFLALCASAQQYPGPLPIEMSSGKSGLVRKGLVAGWDLKTVNLLKWSGDASNASWEKTNSTATATVITETATTGVHYWSQNLLLPIGTQFTFTREYYPNGRDWVRHYVFDGAGNVGAFINVATCTAGATPELSPVLTITSDGYCRVSVSATVMTTTSIEAKGFLAIGDANFFYAGNGTSGVLVRNAQLNEGSTALPYQKTTDLQTVPNMVAGGAALQLGSTSGVDASDPTRSLSGMVFDATDDYLSGVSWHPSLPIGLTIHAVTNTNSAASHYSWIAGDGNDSNSSISGFMFSGSTANTYYVSASGGGKTFNYTAFENGWHEYVATSRIGYSPVLYKDGFAVLSETSTPQASTSTAGTTEFRVGRVAYYSSPGFDGTISYVLIYNRALTPKEVRQNHNWLKAQMAQVGVTLP